VTRRERPAFFPKTGLSARGVVEFMVLTSICTSLVAVVSYPEFLDLGPERSLPRKSFLEIISVAQPRTTQSGGGVNSCSPFLSGGCCACSLPPSLIR